MNAALVVIGARCRLCYSRERCTRCYQVGVGDLLAFRSHDRITRSLIEGWNNPSAELGDSSEAVHLATIVRRGDLPCRNAYFLFKHLKNAQLVLIQTPATVRSFSIRNVSSITSRSS